MTSGGSGWRGVFRIVTCLVAAVLCASAAVTSSAASVAASPPSEPYRFRNVKIGGTGFVTGIVFSQAQKGLAYTRTDVGGMYRWNGATESWTPLLDWVSWDKWGYMGVASVAASPVNANKVWAAVGMYTNGVDPNNGAVLRSYDKGDTWRTTVLPFHLGGNMSGRTMGERLAVDPNNDNILYLAAPSGNGLWRSTDGGVTWARVTAFPNSGDDPQTPGGAEDAGLVWVTFDKSTGRAGTRSKTVYVGVADKANPVYRSTDGGATWAPLAGAPTGYLPHKGVLDPVNHLLYIATSDTTGPFSGGKGDVWKHHTVTGAWTRISPVPSTSDDDYFGYSGLTVDRRNPGTIMVGTQVSWWPDGIIWRSTDSGATWSRIWDWGAWPDRTLRYDFDITDTPWVTMGEQSNPPILVPKIGQAISSMEIDPFDSDRMLFNGGPGIAGTKNLTAWDTGGTVAITPEVEGLEEGAVQGLIKPPGGALLSAMGDVGGFRHDDLNASPATIFTSPVFTTTRSIDFAERNPRVIVRAGDFNDADRPGDSHAAFSTDGGATWFQGTEPSGVNVGGSIAAAADGGRFVWAPGDSGQQVVHSVGYGTSWTASTGVPANAIITSDRVDPMKFYAFSNGTFYVSTDGGASFTASAATGLPATNWNLRVKAVPGREGDIWVAGGATWTTYGLWHSTDSGATFTRVSGVEQADNIGFGKAAPGRAYPALYTGALIGGQRGLFRSDDAGASWVRVNDDRHQYGGTPEALTGDPAVYGRVYFSGYGRGILYGDRAVTRSLR
ncbi:xyloglucanase [Sphaerisporangium sp. TRM90804]|uniref:WD40/YVTN/BNR-like repeat-containing protein n=1 Tax=Sphaerisporangium sp. TRM90804 TaxID=3031113 RepID=UPI00244838CA|nr:xyloglucanase [Sphaerisporangium sp. TRM90804]MDH2428430.1 xyloglucanase [Sphaerisporangium sp. TRM90804]